MSKKIFIALAIIVGLALIAAAVYLLATGLPRSGGQLRELSANEAKWQAHAIAHYEMQVGIMCFCPFRDLMPLTVEVLNGEVVSVVDNTGARVLEDDPVRQSDPGDVLTVDGLFAYARRAIQQADKVTLEYDAAGGYPVTIGVDWLELAMDDEMDVSVSDFQVLP